MKTLRRRLLDGDFLSISTDLIQGTISTLDKLGQILRLDAPSVRDPSLENLPKTTDSVEIVESNAESIPKKTAQPKTRCLKEDPLTGSTCMLIEPHNLHVDKSDPDFVFTWNGKSATL